MVSENFSAVFVFVVEYAAEITAPILYAPLPARKITQDVITEAPAARKLLGVQDYTVDEDKIVLVVNEDFIVVEFPAQFDIREDASVRTNAHKKSALHKNVCDP